MPYRQTFDLTVVSRDDYIYPDVLRALSAADLLDVQLERTTTVEEIPGPNRERLIKLATWAAGEKAKQELGLPSEWDQLRWFKQTSCGTVCCLAGKTAIDAGATPVPEHWEPGMSAAAVQALWNSEPVTNRVVPPGSVEPVRIEEYAREQLGLTHSQAERLFAGSNTMVDVLRVVGDLLALAEPEEQADTEL